MVVGGGADAVVRDSPGCRMGWDLGPDPFFSTFGSWDLGLRPFLSWDLGPDPFLNLGPRTWGTGEFRY